MSSHKKDKKHKQKNKIQNQLEQEKTKFEIIELLNTSLLNTKPNIGQFLKKYVKDITAFCNSKLEFYPMFSYKISKIFVKFLDGHELIYFLNADDEHQKYFLYFNTDEIELKQKKDVELVQNFFECLIKFKFVFSNN